jgi:hypothetical protein
MIEYMAFKAHYETVGPKEEIPVHELMDRIPPEIVLELSVVHFLSPASYIHTFRPQTFSRRLPKQ